MSIDPSTEVNSVGPRERSLYDLASALSEANTVEEVLDAAAESLAALAGAGALSVYLREGGRFTVRRGHGGEPWDAAAEAAGAGKPAVLRGLVAIPFTPGEGGVVGAAAVRFEKSRDFAPEELDFLAAAGRQCGVALERAVRFDALARENTRLRGVLEQLPSGVVVAEAPAGRLLLHNQEAVRLMGHPIIPAQNFTGYAEYGALHDDGTPYQPEEHPLARALRGETVRQERVLYRRGDGGLAHFLASASPLRDSGGGIAAGVVSFQDASELVRVQSELAAASERLARVLESTTDNVLAIRRDWRIAYMNGRARATFQRRDMTGQVFWEAFPGAEGSEFERRYRAAVETSRPQHFEAYYAPLKAWYEVHAYPDRDGLILYFRDVTERRNAEIERDRRRAEIEALYQSAPVGLCVLDRDLRFVQVNRRLAEISGMPAEAHIGRTLREIVPGVADHAETVLRQVLETGEPLLNVQSSGVTAARPGVERFWNEHMVPLKDGSGRVVGISVAVEEITDHKRAEEAMRRRTAELDSLLTNAPIGFAFFDREHRYVRVNEELCRLNGLPAEAHIGRRVGEVLPLDTSTTEQAIDDVFATGRAVESEVTAELRGQPGAKRTWLTGFYPVLGEGGEGSRVGAFVIEMTARKRTEEALRESEERFRTMADNISQFAWMADANGWIFWYNRRWYEYTGTNLEEMQGWGWRKVHHPDHVARVVDRIKHSFETGEAWEDTFPLRGKDGGYRWFLSRALPIRDAEGRVVRWFGTNTDITEHLETEERLRESEQRYRTLFESMHEGFALAEIVLDGPGKPVDWRYLEINAAFESTHGYRREEIVGRTFREIFPRADWEYWVPACGAVALTGKPAQLDHFDSDRHWEATVYSPRQGQFAIIFSDVTERRRVEEALRDRERQFRELADAVPQLVWIADGAGYVTYWNRRWYDQAGVGPEESLDEQWVNLVHPDDRAGALSQWRRSVATGERYEAEYRLRTADGGYRWYLDRGLPFRDGEGRVARWVGTCTDVEESKRAEERLRQTQKLESVGLLAGGIAHDFNNLLTGIMGNASLALDDAGPGAAERIEEVIVAAERAASLTRQLLAYSGKGQFIVRDLDVSEAVHEMSDLVQFSIPKSVELALNVQKRLPAVRMDPGQLQQILMNLVINAGEAIGEGNPGRITVSTSLRDVEEPFIDALGQEVGAGRYVCIEVGDTGGGIDEHARSRIFDPFFTTKFTGRGLGLAAVAGIVRSQKGAIAMESVPGRGSTFRVFLPLADGRSHRTAGDPKAAGRATVLVVDDEASVRDFIATVLRRHRYRVLTAADGRDALSVFQRENGKIDALVLDVVMPVMSANELLPAIKERRPEAKVLLTSGYSESEARRLCAVYPGAAFIQKPYTASQIAAAVEELLGGG